jgi:hypothetical protein
MDWKAVVGTVAPWLGTALGGPLGGMAVTAVADALGLSTKTEESIKQALSGVTPEQMLALKNADQAFQVKMQELGFQNEKDMEALAVSDRDSARKREATVGDNTVRVLAYLITLGFFGVLSILMFTTIHQEVKDVLFVMLGALGSGWQSCVSYYFGTSKGSKDKTDLLFNSTPIK